MEQPRFNQFSIVLPHTFIPEFILDMFKDIMRDDDALDRYLGDPLNCISESMTGISLPGTNVKLLEQTFQDNSYSSSKTRYWPRGNNAMRIIDDNSIAMQFRLVDGFYNYAMLAMAVQYEANDEHQNQQGELFKSCGDVVSTLNLGSRWQLHTKMISCVLESIDNVTLQYSTKVQEAQFNVRVKFADYKQFLTCDGVVIDPVVQYNKNKGN